MTRILLSVAACVLAHSAHAGTTIYVTKPTCVRQAILDCADTKEASRRATPSQPLKELAGCATSSGSVISMYGCDTDAQRRLLELCIIHADISDCETSVEVPSKQDLLDIMEALQDRQDARFEKMLKALSESDTAPVSQ